MPGRSDIAAGRAHVTLYTKNSPLINGLQAATAKLKQFGLSIGRFAMNIAKVGGSAAMAVGTAVAGAIAHFAKVGSELNDMSARTGLAASTLAELQYAAEQTGAEMSDLENAIKRSQKSGKNFFKIADEIAAIEDPALRTRKALEAWGKSGTNLLPMVNDLKALREEARAKGLVPTDQAVADADMIGDKFDTVWKQLKQGLFELGALAAPALVPIADTISNVLSMLLKWSQSNDLIISDIRAMSEALMAGDLALAGEIIIKQWQIAFQNGLVLISTMCNGIIGDTISKIGTDLIRGDLGAAWDTTVKGMGAVWDSLIAGMVGAFKTATSNIRAMIGTITNQISLTAYSLADFVDKSGAPGSKQIGAAIRQAGAGAAVVGTGADAKLKPVESAAAALESFMASRAAKEMADVLEHVSDGSEEATAALVKLQQEMLERQARAKKGADAVRPELKKKPDLGADAVRPELKKKPDLGAFSSPGVKLLAPTFSASALARVGARKGGDEAVKRLDRMIKIEEGIKAAIEAGGMFVG